MKWHNITQAGNPEWELLRAGKVTASKLHDVMAQPRSKSQEFGEPAHRYAIRLGLERINGGPVNHGDYQNHHMARGNEQEPVAKRLYEQQEVLPVGTLDKGGFFCDEDEERYEPIFLENTAPAPHSNPGLQMPQKRVVIPGKRGYSPDGIVGDDGLVEIKSVLCNVQFDTTQRGGYDPAYKWQLIGGLLFTGRKWIDFVSYCSDYPEGKKLYIYRLHADACADMFDEVEARLGAFEKLIEAKQEIILR